MLVCNERRPLKNTVLNEQSFTVYGRGYTAVERGGEVSRLNFGAMMVYFPAVVAGGDSCQQNETIRQAINIDGGVIQDPSILSFQKREPHYPHAHINPVVE